MADVKVDPRAEYLRLEEEKNHESDNGLWRKWGPYLSERQWGDGPRGLQRGWQRLGIFSS